MILDAGERYILCLLFSDENIDFDDLSPRYDGEFFFLTICLDCDL
jgi:hypothetical protein